MGKRWIAVGALALGATACGSSNTGSAEPTACAQGVVSGTYLLHFTTVSGDCGTIPDSLTNTAAASSCTLTTDTASDGDCRFDYVETCNANGILTNSTGFLIIDAADGSRVHGEFTETLTGIGVACTGTYQVTYTRQ